MYPWEVAVEEAHCSAVRALLPAVLLLLQSTVTAFRWTTPSFPAKTAPVPTGTPVTRGPDISPAACDASATHATCDYTGACADGLGGADGDRHNGCECQEGNYSQGTTAHLQLGAPIEVTSVSGNKKRSDRARKFSACDV